jgi:hypothetical protein
LLSFLKQNKQHKNKLIRGNKMSNTKVKEAENEVLDYLLDNWESTDTEVKINYLRLLVKKYYQERAKYEHY